jgi:acyl-CoA reductase-like NAD-dependent aldehyde dehydrogenase
MHVRSVDPRTGLVNKEIPSAKPEEVQEALVRARRAQSEWASLSKDDRIKVLKAAERLFLAERDDIVNLIQSETGFPRRDILGAYNGALRGVDYYAGNYLAQGPKGFELDQAAWPDTDIGVEFVPHGVIAHIGIWNYPFWQTMITAIPALMTGNAIVFKPSEHTSLTGLRISDVLHRAGVPKDVFITLVGGKDVGQEMVRGNFDALVFTGGQATGLEIMHRSDVKPLILELSGNDPAIVCGDADVQQASRGIAYGSLYHAGQVCIRVKRVYVVRSKAEELVAGILDIARGLDVEQSIGPLISAQARAKVQGQVKEAVESGAELLVGGKPIEGPGFYFEPTVLMVRYGKDVRFDQEIFGPVCPIIVVEDEAEALKRANDSCYGLGATVWSQDQAKALEIASRLEAGTVWINECCRTFNCGEYFQGWKSSGLASSQDRLSMFMKKKAIIHNRSCKPRDHWFR